MAQKFLKNKKGAVGIGTLIIFIALVLVAAVAASVIINTAGKLQHKAATVGEQSTEQVASGLQILKIVGNCDGTTIDKIGIIVSPNVGGEIDLATTIVSFAVDDKKISLAYGVDDTSAHNISKLENGTRDIFAYNADQLQGAWPYQDDFGNNADDGYKFGIIVLQDGDGSVTGTHPTINYGDKVMLAINIANILENDLEPRQRVIGEVIPEYGASGIIDFRTPSEFTEKVVTLQ